MWFFGGWMRMAGKQTWQQRRRDGRDKPAATHTDQRGLEHVEIFFFYTKKVAIHSMWTRSSSTCSVRSNKIYSILSSIRADTLQLAVTSQQRLSWLWRQPGPGRAIFLLFFFFLKKLIDEMKKEIDGVEYYR
jgi:hypothetical protein